MILKAGGIFFLLVAVFVVYQQRESGWTWREFLSGMGELAWRAALLIVGLFTHVHLPLDEWIERR